MTVVLGAQWGDEGKGKVVDLLAQDADIVCRCQVREAGPWPGTPDAVRCHLELRPSGCEPRGTPAPESRVMLGWFRSNLEDARRLSCSSGSGDPASGALRAERWELPPEACSWLPLRPGEDPARPTRRGGQGQGRDLFPKLPEIQTHHCPTCRPWACRTSPPLVHFVDIRCRCGVWGPLFRVLCCLFVFPRIP